MDKNTEAFLSLVRAGLWESEVQLLPFGVIDFDTILAMAEEQGVVGLVAAGIEHVTDGRPAKKDVLQFIGRTVQMEQRNQAMNYFIGVLVEKMKEEGIFTLLVKGQGVAQCYERPPWRPSGDVDFLLDAENYKKAKAYLLPLSSGNKNEERYSQHLGISIDPWYVEIHGTLRSGLSARVDRMIDAVQTEVFRESKVRTWKNDATEVYLPAPDHDVFLVFTHFIKHFYKEGMTLRQVGDWCRLLYTYRKSLDSEKLESWIRKSGMMIEWKTFAALAVQHLGMPEEAMPLYDSRFKVKGSRLVEFILGGYSGNKVKDTWQIAKIFPWKAMHYAPGIFLNVNWLKVKEIVFKSK